MSSQGLSRTLFFIKLGLISSLVTAGGYQSAFAQNAKLSAASSPSAPSAAVPEAVESARVQQKLKQVSQVRAENYDLQRHPVSDSEAQHWKNILWTTAIVEPQDPFVASALSSILLLSRTPGLSSAQRRTVDMAFQIGTQLYLKYPAVYFGVGQQFAQTLTSSADPNWVAMSLSGLAKSRLSPAQLQQLSERVRQRFPQWQQSAVLYTTLQDVQGLAQSSTPPLKDLLNWTIAPGQMQLYVICTRDRDALCQTVLKNGQGNFVRTAEPAVSTADSIPQRPLWSMPLLLRSIHGLGWNFTRGETPQGVYRIEGTTPQPDYDFFRAYGQFSLINLYVPFEVGAREFLPGRSGPFAGSLESYRTLLPPTWRSYSPMEQSYWAGRMGRGLFRIHGSGEATDFFRKRPTDTAVSWNPTLGCLSALELYDQTGKLQRADMPKILGALRTASAKMSGYLIVVEVPSATQRPISVEDIEAALR